MYTQTGRSLLRLANVIEIQTVYTLLAETGIITQQEHLGKLKRVRDEYRMGH